MKRLVTLLAVMAVTVMALDARTFSFKGFDEIDASYIYEITLTRSAAFSVEVDASADLEKYVDVHMSGHKLVLTTKNLPRRVKTDRGSYIKARISMPELNYVALSGAAQLWCYDTFGGKESFLLEMSGASELTGLGINGRRSSYLDISGAAELEQISVNSELLYLESSGASRVRFVGECCKASFELSGASKQKVDIAAEELSIDMGGASKMDIHNRKPARVEAELSGTACVNYEGETLSVLEVESSGVSEFDSGDVVAESVEVDAGGASKVRVLVSKRLEAGASGTAKVMYREAGRLEYISKESSAAGKVEKLN